MKKKRHSNEQIVAILREADATTITAAAKKYAVSEQTIYRWRRLYDGMETNDVRELKALRDENLRLKKLPAERDLEVDVMREVSAKSGDPAGAACDGAIRLLPWGVSAPCLPADVHAALRASLLLGQGCTRPWTEPRLALAVASSSGVGIPACGCHVAPAWLGGQQQTGLSPVAGTGPRPSTVQAESQDTNRRSH